MATIKQIAANRRNAQKSTGPRSSAGKTQAALNARKHGFAGSSFTVVRLEDLKDIDNLRQDALDFYRPVNSQEIFAVERIALCQMALLRIARLESGILTTCLDRALYPDDEPIRLMTPELAGEFRSHEADGLIVRGKGSIEAGGQDAGLESGNAEEGHLTEGDALDGEDLLRVDGAVEVEGVLAKVVDVLEVFEANDSERGTGETVFAGVEGGLSFARGGTGAGGLLCVAAVGGDLFDGGHRAELPFNSGVAWRLGKIAGWERGSGLESAQES